MLEAQQIILAFCDGETSMGIDNVKDRLYSEAYGHAEGSVKYWINFEGMLTPVEVKVGKFVWTDDDYGYPNVYLTVEGHLTPFYSFRLRIDGRA